MPVSSTTRRRGRPPKARVRLPPSLDSVLTVRVDQAAALIGCGVSKVKELIADGTIESTKLGSMRLVRVSSLRRLVGENSAAE